MRLFPHSWLNCRVLSGTHRDLGEKYRAILDNILTHGEDELVEGLKIFIEAIVNENVSLVISRQLLSEVGNTLAQLEDSVSKAVSHFTIDIVQPRVISFEDQVVTIRTHLADIYEREQNWSEAGKVLVGIPLETGQKQYSVDFKLETYLKIARWVGLSLQCQWWNVISLVEHTGKTGFCTDDLYCCVVGCTWRTRTRSRARPTSTGPPSCRPRPRTTTCRSSIKCARAEYSTSRGSS